MRNFNKKNEPDFTGYFHVLGGCAAVACIIFDFVTKNIKIMADFMQIILKNIPDFMSRWIDSISNI